MSGEPRRTPRQRPPDPQPIPEPVLQAGSLNLPENIGLPEVDQDATHQKWNTFDAVMREVEELGFSTPERPPYRLPTLTPEQLNSTNNFDYTTLYAQFHGWLIRGGSVLAETKGRILGIDNEMNEIERRVRKQVKEENAVMAKGDRLNAQDIKDMVESDIRYNQLVLLRQVQVQKRLMIEARYDGIDATCKVISRQIEIRKLDMSGHQRENNMPGRNRDYGTEEG